MKGTGISAEDRQKVFDRDNIDGWLCCIYCGNPHGVELAHYVPRSQGGKGVVENLCPLCHKCHAAMDNGSDTEKANLIKAVCKDHLERHYPGWEERTIKVQKEDNK